MLSELSLDNLKMNVNYPGKYWVNIEVYNGVILIGNLKTKGITYSEFNYIKYTDTAADNYEGYVDSIDSFIKNNSKKSLHKEKLALEINSLLYSGIKMDLFFAMKNIQEISVVSIDDYSLHFVLQALVDSDFLKIKKIYTAAGAKTVDVWSNKKSSIMTFKVEHMNGKIDICSEDCVLVDGYDDNMVVSAVKKLSSNVVYLDAIISYLKTKRLFDSVYMRRSEHIIAIRVPDPSHYRMHGYKSDGLSSNEMMNIRKNGNVLPKELSAKVYKGKDCYYQLFKNVEKKNIMQRNGVRNSLGISTTVPKVYIFGNEVAGGNNNRDEETIASKLQMFLDGKYQVVNYANFTGQKYIEMFKLLQNISIERDDVVVFILNNYLVPGFVNIESEFAWDALPEDISKIDTYPAAQKHDRKDWFLARNSFTEDFNIWIAEKITKAIFDKNIH